jgi:DNA-binding XRE family transcriptional regulator
MSEETINQRMRKLREHLDLGRQAFADKTGLKKKTIENIESEQQRINGEQISAVVKAFPKYAYWLTTGLELTEVGQISPMTEEIREQLNIKAA